ncbi:S-adenosylmethionine:tRNA ribosyltransferase-isomerase [Elusimicrobiota bacterium]
MEVLEDYKKIKYDLPREKIALYPAEPRDSCKLMVVHLPSFQIEDVIFKDICRYFHKRDVIAVNNSRVISARLKGSKITGGKAEFLLLEKIDENRWESLGKPYSRLNEGAEIKISSPANATCRIRILKKKKDGRFLLETPSDIVSFGHIPLPPYIITEREITARDSLDYQTVFSEIDGSVASSTAALHFTKETVGRLISGGVDFVPITLHIGSGTFRSNYERPEPESFIVTEDNACKLNEAKRICVCGTTVMRTVETVYDGNRYNAGSGKTGLFIGEGHKFSGVDMFLTNFHLQGTPLLFMVAAYLDRYFPGEGSGKLIQLYERALNMEYRFLSYGDTMLFIDEEKIVE